MFALGSFILDGARWAGRRGLATPKGLMLALRAANALGRAAMRTWRNGPNSDHR